MYIRNAHGEYNTPKVSFEGKKCCVKNCNNDATDRAHIRKFNKNGEYSNRTVYIVPMCTEHNRSRTDKVFEVKENTPFEAINP